MKIFEMFGDIALKGAKQAEMALDTIDKKGHIASKAFGVMSKGAVALGIGITAVVGSVTAMTLKTMKATDAIDKNAQRVGLSRKSYQEWEFILSQSGSSIESMNMGMKTLTQRMDESLRKVGEGTRLFRRLGIEITDSMSQEEAFEQTVKALQAMEEGAEKTNLAIMAFGRSGQELLPMLNSNTDSIDEFRAEAERLGLVLSDDVVDSGVRLTDTLDKLRRAFSSAMYRAVSPFIPQIEKLANVFIDKLVPAFQNALTWATNISMSIPVVFGFMRSAIELIGGRIAEAVEKPWGVIKSFVADIIKWAGEIGVFSAINIAWNWAVNASGNFWTFMKDEGYPWLKDIVKTAWNWTVGFFGSNMQWIFDNAIPWIRDGVRTLWTWSVEILGEVFEGLQEGVRTGDWTKLLGTGLGITKTGLLIAVGFEITSAMVVAFLAKAQQVLSGLGFAIGAVGKLGVGGVLATVSLAVALTEAKVSGEWNKFANKITSALALGALGFVLNPALGLWMTTLALTLDLQSMTENLPDPAKVASDLKDWVKSWWDILVQKIYDYFTSMWEGLSETAKVVWDGMGGDLARNFAESFVKVLSIFDLVGAILKLWNAIVPQLVQWWRDKGKEFADAFTTNLMRVLKVFDLVGALKTAWGLLFNRGGKEMADDIADGFISGLENSRIEKDSLTFWETIQKGWNMVWGIKSPSTVTKEMGLYIIEGLMEGLKSKDPELYALFMDMVDNLTSIWNPVTEEIEQVVNKIDEPLIKVESKFQRFVNKIKDIGKNMWDFMTPIFDGILESIVGASNVLGSAVSGFTEGYESKRETDDDGKPVEGMTGAMLSGGIQGMLVGLLTQSEGFQKLMEGLNPILQSVSNAFGVVFELLMPILKPLETLGKAISNLVFALMPLVKLFIDILMPVIVFLSNLITGLVTVIVNAINAIIKLINRLPFVNIQLVGGSDGISTGTKTEQSRGGAQFAEITGASRDLFVDLLSPLASLNSLTGIANRIYDILDERLQTGVTIENITINPSANIGMDFLDELEEALAGRGISLNRGFANA